MVGRENARKQRGGVSGEKFPPEEGLDACGPRCRSGQSGGLRQPRDERPHPLGEAKWPKGDWRTRRGEEQGRAMVAGRVFVNAGPEISRVMAFGGSRQCTGHEAWN